MNDEYTRWIKEMVKKVICPSEPGSEYDILVWLETFGGDLIDPVESADINSVYVVQISEITKYSLFNIRFRFRGEYVLECCGNTNDEDVINDIRKMLGKPFVENARTMKLKEDISEEISVQCPEEAIEHYENTVDRPIDNEG